ITSLPTNQNKNDNKNLEDIEFVLVETGIELDANDKKEEFRYDLKNNKRKNYAKDISLVNKRFGIMASLENIKNILNYKANHEEKDELFEDEFEKSLAEVDIINISSNNPLINKEFFDILKKTAQSQPPSHIKVDRLKK
ncbi:34890_t:CDS:2, partial [Racocetra persica]